MSSPSPPIAVVTGANTGIGYQTAKGLAERGFEVVMACRNQDRAQVARTRLLQEVPHAHVRVEIVDLADPDSIEDFGKRMRKHAKSVDVLVNNAGLWNRRRRENVEGLELTFAVNHLGPFRLTHGLLPLLEAGHEGRIVTVASTAHHFAKPDWDDLQMHQKYEGNTQYGNSKLYNIWFSDELALRAAGRNVTSNALHPGSGITDLTRDFPSFVGPLFKPFLKTPERLAYTSIRLATDPELAGSSGGYYHLDRDAHRGRHARDKEAAARMWHITEDLA